MVSVPPRLKRSAFEEFYEAHFVRMRAVLSLAIGDLGRAEEATQEAFLRAFARWNQVRKLDRPFQWVFVVALNVFRDAQRHDDRQPSDSSPLGELRLDDRIDNRLDIVRTLKLLPPRQRQVLVLRYIADLSTAETAEAMGCAEGTVRASLHAAVQKVGELMGEQAT